MLLKSSTLLVGQIPAAHLTELKAAGRSAQLDADFLLLGNVLYDISKIAGCSALLVERERSANGEILFGRNMDFPTFGFLDRCGMLVVYVPKGKHAFASVTFPGLFGVVSGMNDAGLAVAQLEVNQAKDGSRLNPAGTPLALCFRRLLEECRDAGRSRKAADRDAPLLMCNLAICDRQQTAVLEITTRWSCAAKRKRDTARARITSAPTVCALARSARGTRPWRGRSASRSLRSGNWPASSTR